MGKVGRPNGMVWKEIKLVATLYNPVRNIKRILKTLNLKSKVIR